MNLWLVLRVSQCVGWTTWHYATSPFYMNTNNDRNYRWLYSLSVPPGWKSQLVTGRRGTAAWEPRPASQGVSPLGCYSQRSSCLFTPCSSVPSGVPSRPFCTLRDDNQEAFIASSGSGLWCHSLKRQLTVIGGLLVWTGMSNSMLT